MKKFNYSFTSIATGLKDLTITINKNHFDKMIELLRENVHNNKNADYWMMREHSGLFYETRYYFEFKSEKMYVLYILTVRKAEEGCYFI